MLRRKVIESFTTQQAYLFAGGLTVLWDKLAAAIILLIGEAGFYSLYSRSLFLTQSKFPWLDFDNSAGQANPCFENLKASLQQQPEAIAIEANRQLLITLTDILASLIGDSLTNNVLNSAWDISAEVEPNGDKPNDS